MRPVGMIPQHRLMALSRRAFAAVFMTLLLVGAGFPQSGVNVPQVGQTAEKLGTLAPQERLDLIAKLDDTQIRELLIYYLDKTAPQPAAKPSGPEDLFRD